MMKLLLPLLLAAAAGAAETPRLEGELIAIRTRRLAGVAVATIVGILIALFAPSA